MVAMDEGSKPKGHPVALDPKAVNSNSGEPPFIAPPPGAPAYYGFAVLEDVNVEGFTLGAITDFEAESCDYGDAFVVAPDNSRCGLVWDVSLEDSLETVIAPEPNRWGVWAVSFPHPMNSRENARRNLEHILPRLKQEWGRWVEQRAGSDV